MVTFFFSLNKGIRQSLTLPSLPLLQVCTQGGESLFAFAFTSFTGSESDPLFRGSSSRKVLNIKRKRPPNGDLFLLVGIAG